jgi:hypothetical protein
MKAVYLFLLLISFSSIAQEKTSTKKFDAITLLNNIEFENSKFNQPKFSCGFLLKYQNDTFAVTAKHLLQIIHPPEMKTVLFDKTVKSWTMFRMDNKQETVVTYKLINENPAESLTDKSIYDNDFLIFSVKENHSTVKPLEPRTTALVPGEKLYVIGWTRTMEEGPQRVYEFEYYKTIGHRILLKEQVVPPAFGGLSGAPVVDEQGLLVGLVSNGTVDPVTGTKFFSPCSIENLLEALKTEKKE